MLSRSAAEGLGRSRARLAANPAPQGGVGQAAEILVCGARHLLDAALPLALVPQKCGHYRENIRATAGEHDAGVDADAIELARLVGRGHPRREAFAKAALLRFFQQIDGGIALLDGLQEADDLVG